MSTYTNDQIRSAILRAADRIELNPKLWNHDNTRIPDCGAPGCALGWIGHEVGIECGKSIAAVHAALGLEGSWQFYNQMSEMGFIQWRRNPTHGVAALRAYADRYFPDSTTVVSSAYDPAYVAFRQKLCGQKEFA
jgi:hypothetical protein